MLDRLETGRRKVKGNVGVTNKIHTNTTQKNSPDTEYKKEPLLHKNRKEGKRPGSYTGSFKEYFIIKVCITQIYIIRFMLDRLEFGRKFINSLWRVNLFPFPPTFPSYKTLQTIEPFPDYSTFKRIYSYSFSQYWLPFLLLSLVCRSYRVFPYSSGWFKLEADDFLLRRSQKPAAFGHCFFLCPLPFSLSPSLFLCLPPFPFSFAPLISTSSPSLHFSLLSGPIGLPPKNFLYSPTFFPLYSFGPSLSSLQTIVQFHSLYLNLIIH